MFEVRGKAVVNKIVSDRSGQSQRGSWRVVRYLLKECDDVTFPCMLQIEIFGEEAICEADLKVGEMILFVGHVISKEWKEGTYNTSVRATRIEKLEQDTPTLRQAVKNVQTYKRGEY